MTLIDPAALLPAGAWLWSAFGVKVVEWAGRHIGEAGRQTWAKVDWQQAAERYRQEMQRLYGTMRIVGMAQPVPLSNIFTDVYLLDKPSAWRRHNIDELAKLMALEGMRHQVHDQRYPALEFAQQHPHLMILGKPGAGKTTLLKHLVLQATTGQLDAVPIFVGLKAWSDSDKSLIEFLARQFEICSFPNAQPFIETILRDGKAMVLFDGLDEVNLEQGARERITCAVRDFADQYAASRVLITCRTAASDYQFEHFTYCELSDFSEDQMRGFVQAWFQHDPIKQQAFLVEFDQPEHKGLRDLARTPLLLTLLCLTFEESMSFPRQRAEIYEEALDALLKKWDSSRNIRRDQFYRKLTLVRKRGMLASLAFHTFIHSQIFLKQEDIVEKIEMYLRDLPSIDITEDIDGESVLRALEAHHGLLIERAYKIFSFSHLTFQEYFTARYIVEHPSREMFDRVIQHAHDAQWREVMLLVSSSLDSSNAAIFFSAFQYRLNKLSNNPKTKDYIQWTKRKTAYLENTDKDLITTFHFIYVILNDAYPFGFPIIHDISFRKALLLLLDGNFIRDKSGNLTHLTLDLIQMINKYFNSRKDILTDFCFIYALNQIKNFKSEHRTRTKKLSFEEIKNMFQFAYDRSPQDLQQALSVISFPDNNDSAEEWSLFTNNLRDILIHQRDIGHDWSFDDQTISQLNTYFSTYVCMLDCLDLAAVSDREAIRAGMLPKPEAP